MAAGDLLVADMQYEFRNFMWGAGTPYINEKTIGLHSMSDVGNYDSDFDGDHGAVPGQSVLRKRIITHQIKPDLTAATVEAALNTMKATFQLPRKRYSRNLEQYAFRRGGVKKFLWVRCDKRDIPSDYKLAQGAPDVFVSFTAPDPVIYGLALKSLPLTLGIGVTNGGNNFINDGDFRDGYEPTITITGPATNPRISSTQDDNRQLKLTGVFNAGQTIVVNFRTKTITVNGVVNHSILANDSQWFAILPGNNTLTYNRDGGNTGASSTATVEWRDTWQ